MLNDRFNYYQSIERLRKRPLIVFVTSSRPNANGTMAADSIPEMLEQLEAIPQSEAAVDLLVVSQGGDPTVAWRMMCLLRERFAKVSVLVPQSAFSAATLLCLGADEIIMHPHGNLGPVDPQITSKRRDDKDIRFGYEEVLSFIGFIRDQAHITDQANVATILGKLIDDVGCVSVGVALRGSMLSQTLGENLLRMHMKGEGENVKAKDIAEALNKKFYHHGHALGRKEAGDIGLKIAENNPQLNDLMWRVWVDIEAELQMREAYSALTELSRSSDHASLFAPPASLSLPSGLPPALMQQIAQQVLSVCQPRVDNLPLLRKTTYHALMESSRLASRFALLRGIQGARQVDGGIQIHELPLWQGWEKMSIPAQEQAAQKPLASVLPEDSTADTIDTGTSDKKGARVNSQQRSRKKRV